MARQEVVKDFIEKVQWSYDSEYGDFKRRLDNYIERLRENLPNSHPECQKIVEQMKSDVVFNPNGDIEATRYQVLEKSQKLLKILAT